MGRYHADAIRRAGATVAAIVDVRAEPRNELARRFSAGSHDTLARALERGADVVHICTPLSSHFALCREALDRGAHVVVEKPATPTGGEAAELVEHARAARRYLVPVHQFSFQPGVMRLLAELPRLGRILHVEFATSSAGAETGFTGNPDEHRDAVAAEITPHALALFRRFTALDTAELDWRLHRPAAGEWRFSSSTGGISLQGFISLAGRPTFIGCRIIAERGTGHADLAHGFSIIEPGASSRNYKIVRPLLLGTRTAAAAAINMAGRVARREGAYPGLRHLIAGVYGAIQSPDTPPPVSFEELLDVARARDRLIQLAR